MSHHPLKGQCIAGAHDLKVTVAGSANMEKAKSPSVQHQSVSDHSKHLVRADGKRIWIASNPIEAQRLLQKLHKDDTDSELVIHGSDEHINLLRHVHSVHQEKRQEYQQRHGEHFNELEAAIRDMDAVRKELKDVEDRILQLDAAAEKYGFDSHVRLQSSPENCTVTKSGRSQDLEEERRNQRSMAFFREPTLRQYYHNGLLWRTNALHEASSYEMFVDLVYVGVVGFTGDIASADANGHSLLRFVITFLMAWKFWTEISVYSTSFVEEDILRRLSIIFVLICLLGLTINMEGFYADTYTALVAFYATAGLMSAFSWLWYGSILPSIKATCIIYASFLFFSVPLWIGSVHDHTNTRYILVAIALFVDVQDDLKWIIVMLGKRSHIDLIRTKFEKWFEYMPANSLEHIISRMDAFVSLVLGYSVVSLLYVSAAANPMNYFFAKAALGLMQAFALNALYFEMDSFNLYRHALRRHHRFFEFVWKMMHIPFVMSFVLSAATISRLVLAHDSPGCPIDALGTDYTSRSQPRISQGQRWFYCAGLGISLICTSIIANVHKYKRPSGTWFWQHRKNARLGFRAMVGVAILLLPLARERLNSVELIATTAGLVHLCLFMELLGNVLDVRLAPKVEAVESGEKFVSVASA